MHISKITLLISIFLFTPMSIRAMCKVSPTRSPFSMKNIEREQMQTFNWEILTLIALYEKARRSGSALAEKENLQEKAQLIEEYSSCCEDQFAQSYAQKLLQIINTTLDSEMVIEPVRPRHCLRAKRNLVLRSKAMQEAFENEPYIAREIQIPVAQLTPVVVLPAVIEQAQISE